MRNLLPHHRRLLAFLLLNGLDLALTWQLVEPDSPYTSESNPVANWWLLSYGWAGLVGFKAAMALFAAGLFVVIARNRPSLGKGVLNLSCLLVAGVVLYSGYLLAGNYSALATVRRERQKEADAEQRAARCHELLTFQARLERELSAGRCPLAEAVGRLAHSERARDQRFRSGVRKKFPSVTEEEGFAAFLIEGAVSFLYRNRAAAAEVATRLEAEYRAQFGEPPPFSVDDLLASLPHVADGDGGDHCHSTWVALRARGGRHPGEDIPCAGATGKTQARERDETCRRQGRAGTVARR